MPLVPHLAHECCENMDKNYYWPKYDSKLLIEENSKIVVPGKLMGSGNLTKKVTVSAYSFTKSATEKIEKAGGKCVHYNDFIKSNPKGKDVMVIG